MTEMSEEVINLDRETLTIIDESDYLVFDLCKAFSGKGPLLMLSATGREEVIEV